VKQNLHEKPGQAQVLAGIVFIIFFTVAFLVGCSTPAKQKWLPRFFDGVPVPGVKTNQTAVQYDEDGRPLVFKEALQINLTPPVVPSYSRHPPYENKECSECHKSKYSPELKGPENRICFACHDDFLEKAKFKHQPVEECRSCHDPHGSAFPKMLTKPGNSLCFDCHEEKDLSQGNHVANAKKDCLLCHEPHVGHDEFLLKLDEKQVNPKPATAK
jgi:predicted CXXCH cytochrome family protein